MHYIAMQAARILSQTLARTAPSRRRALLVDLMKHCGEGLAVIRGAEGAAEEAYRLGDHLATRTGSPFQPD
jgi:alpha-D-ribose 1-methylphosphonate 5-triphosphate synthase subunit PhnG